MLIRCIAVCSLSLTAPAATIEVSLDGPLRSLEAARDTIRSLRSAGSKEGFTVLVRGGTYRLSRPFVLTPEDSGTPEAPVVYAASPGERVIISGGRVIGEWRPGAEHIWTAQLDEVKGGRWYFRQLFIDGRRAQRARTPDMGYFRIEGPSSKDKPFRLRYSGSNMRKAWEGSGAEVQVLLGWTEIRQQIVRIDEGERVAVLSGDAGGTKAGIPEALDARYFVENVADGLDSAGEWYLDRKSGTLSYWPTGGEKLERAETVAPVVTQLVKLAGDPGKGLFIRNVAFRGLHFADADWDLPPEGHADYPQAAVHVKAAFEAIGAEDCALEDCSFSRIGGYAVWFGHGSKRNRIIGNHIWDIGAGGIKIGEPVTREQPAERNVEHVIEDNTIHHLGEVYPEAVGVWVGQSSRNIIAHNTIHDLTYSGISVGWIWSYDANQCQGNKIEHNHIYEVGKHTLNDLGAIYTLGQQPGTVIRHNLIHDVTSYGERSRGIYLDEGSTGILVENNIVYRCRSAGFHQHYGRDNIVRNNIIAFNHDAQVSRGRSEPHRSFTFERNIVYFDHGKLLAGAWSDTGFAVRNNLYFDARGGDLLFNGCPPDEWRGRTGDADSVIADPLFVNPGRFQFELRPDSPARRIGFEPIDLRDVGARRRAAASGASLPHGS